MVRAVEVGMEMEMEMEMKTTILGGINSYKALGCHMVMRRTVIVGWKTEELNGGRCLVRVRAMLALRRLMMMKMRMVRKEMWRGDAMDEGAGMEVLVRGCSRVGLMLLIHGLMGIEKREDEEIIQDL